MGTNNRARRASYKSWFRLPAAVTRVKERLGFPTNRPGSCALPGRFEVVPQTRDSCLKCLSIFNPI